MGVEHSAVARAQPDALLPVLIDSVQVGFPQSSVHGPQRGLEGDVPAGQVDEPDAVQAADVGRARRGHDERVQRQAGGQQRPPRARLGGELKQPLGGLSRADLVELAVGGFHHQRSMVVEPLFLLRVGRLAVQEFSVAAGVAEHFSAVVEQIDMAGVHVQVLQVAGVGHTGQVGLPLRVPHASARDQPQFLFGVHEKVGHGVAQSQLPEHVFGMLQVALLPQVEAPHPSPGLYP